MGIFSEASFHHRGGVIAQPLQSMKPDGLLLFRACTTAHPARAVRINELTPPFTYTWPRGMVDIDRAWW